LPRLIVTPGATRGLERCRKFLVSKNPGAAASAADAIARRFALLEQRPEIGRFYLDSPDLRELVIPFGSSGYVALYRYEPADDAVYILAFRRQKEAGY
jgi:plasmid stabilization system protein ParE